MVWQRCLLAGRVTGPRSPLRDPARVTGLIYWDTGALVPASAGDRRWRWRIMVSGRSDTRSYGYGLDALTATLRQLATVPPYQAMTLVEIRDESDRWRRVVLAPETRS